MILKQLINIQACHRQNFGCIALKAKTNEVKRVNQSSYGKINTVDNRT